MASKKPNKKKKYVPKPMYYPKLVIAIHSFDPFEKAINRILTDEDVEVDNAGLYVYKNEAGQFQSIEHGLFVYARLVEIYAIRRNIEINTDALWSFYKTVSEKTDMDEAEIKRAREGVALCKKVFLSLSPVESRDIINTILTDMVTKGLA